MKIIDILAILLLSALAISFLSRMGGNRFEGRKLLLCQTAGVLGLTVPLCFGLLSGEPEMINLLPSAAFLFLWSRIALETEAADGLFLSLFSIAVIAVSIYLGALLISFAAGAGCYEILLRLTVWHYALLMLAILIFFYTARVVLRLSDKRDGFGVRDVTFLLVIPVISVISILVLLNLVPAVASEPRLLSLVFAVLAGIILINLLSYYFYVEMGREHEMELKYVLLQKQYDFLLDSNSEIRHYYEETGKLYHDFKRYLTVVLSYLEEEDTQEAKDYIRQLVEMKSTFTNHRIFCDNNAVNYVLNYFLFRCAERGIDCACAVTVSLADVEDMDFCVILNNLLDNAIEAVEKEEKPCVRIEIEPEQTGLKVRIMNRISRSVLETNPHLETTKERRALHGYGVKNVRELVRRYGGGMTYFEEDGFFCCEVTGSFRKPEKEQRARQREKLSLFVAGLLLLSALLPVRTAAAQPAISNGQLKEAAIAGRTEALHPGGVSNEQLKEAAEGIINWKKEQRGLKPYENLFAHPFTENAGNAQADWYAFGMGRFGYPDNYPAYLSAAADYVSQRYLTPQKLHTFKATEWHRISLAVLAMGGDPSCIGQDENGAPINLIADGVYNRRDTASLGEQGVNGWIWGLLALDSLRYQVPEEASDSRRSIITAILSAQLPDGMFAYYPGEGDVDITAMALQALAPYYNSGEIYGDSSHDGDEKTAVTVRQAVDRALEALSSRQRPDGDFYSWGTENVESTAQVLTALCTLGIDPMTDERFIKEGHTLLDGILKYRMEDGGFCHSFQSDPNNPNTHPAESNSMASEQVLYGLCALYRYENRMRNLYDFREEMEPEIRQAVQAAEDAILLLPAARPAGEQEREETRQAFVLYCQVPAGERSYVRNYARLAKAMEALGMEDDSRYLSEAMEENQSGKGHVERIFTEGSIKNGLDVFTQEDMAAYLELPSHPGTRYEREVKELSEKLQKAANSMEYSAVGTGLSEKQNSIEAVKEEIGTLNRLTEEWIAREGERYLKDQAYTEELISRCETLESYDREQVEGYEELKQMREEIERQTRKKLGAASAFAAILLCISGVWIRRRRG